MRYSTLANMRPTYIQKDRYWEEGMSEEESQRRLHAMLGAPEVGTLALCVGQKSYKLGSLSDVYSLCHLAEDSSVLGIATDYIENYAMHDALGELREGSSYSPRFTGSPAAGAGEPVSAPSTLRGIVEVNTIYSYMHTHMHDDDTFATSLDTACGMYKASLMYDQERGKLDGHKAKLKMDTISEKTLKKIYQLVSRARLVLAVAKKLKTAYPGTGDLALIQLMSANKSVTEQFACLQTMLVKERTKPIEDQDIALIKAVVETFNGMTVFQRESTGLTGSGTKIEFEARDHEKKSCCIM